MKCTAVKQQDSLNSITIEGITYALNDIGSEDLTMEVERITMGDGSIVPGKSIPHYKTIITNNLLTKTRLKKWLTHQEILEVKISKDNREYKLLECSIDSINGITNANHLDANDDLLWKFSLQYYYFIL